MKLFKTILIAAWVGVLPIIWGYYVIDWQWWFFVIPTDTLIFYVSERLRR
jgi:hypothetical protein